MTTLVEIQDILSYGLIPVIVMAVASIIPIFLFIIAELRKKSEKKALPAAYEEMRPKFPPHSRQVRDSYLAQLRFTRLCYSQGSIDCKEGYQRLSQIIKGFVNDYSEIDVASKTLAEIRGMELPYIETLVEEYYAVEFAPDMDGDLYKSLDTTEKVIELWN